MPDIVAEQIDSRIVLSPLVIACLAATWFIWGSCYLALKLTLTGFPPFLMMGSRFVVAGALLMTWMRWRKAPIPTLRQWCNAAIIGTLMLGRGMGMTVRAELTVNSGLVVAFIAVTPVMLVAFNLMYRIYPSRDEVVGMLIGLGGVLMLTQGAGYGASPTGLIEVTIAALGWSPGSVLSQRSLPLAPGAVGFAAEMLCGGVVLFALSTLSGERLALSTHAVAWLAWVYLVIFGSLVSFSAYMVLLGRVPSSVASSYTCVNPVIAMLLGVAIGGEHIVAWEWISAGVVLSGVVLLLFGRPAQPAKAMGSGQLNETGRSPLVCHGAPAAPSCRRSAHQFL
jgi:drug/metabolite transporter (DMT)-like permease